MSQPLTIHTTYFLVTSEKDELGPLVGLYQRMSSEALKSRAYDLGVIALRYCISWINDQISCVIKCLNICNH